MVCFAGDSYLQKERGSKSSHLFQDRFAGNQSVQKSRQDIYFEKLWVTALQIGINSRRVVATKMHGHSFNERADPLLFVRRRSCEAAYWCQSNI